METSGNLNYSPNERQSQLEIVLNQLISGKASITWRGVDQVKKWLSENPEDREVYELLLDAAQKNRNFRTQARDLLFEMKSRGSHTAEEALLRFSISPSDLLADADDAYYAGEYKQATDLYRKVLRADPENIRAREQLTKAMFEAQMSVKSSPDLPREALQYFRQARSYIAAKDYSNAVTMLGASIEAAEDEGKTFPDAELLLDRIQNVIIAEGFKKRAYTALENHQWKDALGLFNKAQALDPTDEGLKEEISNMQELVQVVSILRSNGVLRVFIPLGKLQKSLGTARAMLNSESTLLKDIERQVNQIRIFQWFSISLVAMIVLALFFLGSRSSDNNSAVPTFTESPGPVNVIIVPTTTITITSSPVVMNTNTIVVTPTLFLTATVAPTSTLIVLGTGNINLALVTARESPNGTPVETLESNQFVTILEQQNVGGSIWYKCTWDGTPGIGWILAEYISSDIPPISTP